VCSLQEEAGAVLAHLNREEESVCRAFYLEGLPARTVAEQHGKTVDQVYRQLFQVRTRLRRRFRGAVAFSY
jgi:DNA-directed RNA polymerase specialized sigma24 family protein